jgi:hypothetical protein
MVHINTKPEDAKVRINGQPFGMTPAQKSLSDFAFNQYDVTIEKEGYKPISATLEKEFKVGTFIGGFFLAYIPWFWMYGPKPYHYFELDEIHSSIKNEPVLTDQYNTNFVLTKTEGAVGVWTNNKNLKVIVSDFDSSYSLSDGKTIAELFSVELVNRRVMTILDRSKIQSLLDEQKLQLTGITDEKKLIEIGKLLGANKIITGSILKMGENYFITVKGIDVFSGSVEISDKVSSQSINGLINSLPVLTTSFIYKALKKYSY